MTKALSNSFSIEILIQVLWFYEEIGYIAVEISDTCAGDNKFQWEGFAIEKEFCNIYKSNPWLTIE